MGELSEEKLPFDPRFKGPIESRSCRDIFWLVFFVLFWVGMILVAVYGFKFGDPHRLVHPVTSKGYTCGVHEMADYPYLFWPSPKSVANFENGTATSVREVCVTRCPDKGQKVAMGPLGVMTEAATYSTEALASIPGYCLPQSRADAEFWGVFERVNEVFTGVDAQLSRVWENRYILLVALGVAFFASFLWVIFLRLFPGFMVWMTIIGSISVFVLTSLLAWYKAGYIQSSTIVSTAVLDNLKAFQFDQKVFFATAILLTICSIILVLIILVMFKRINIAIGIIREAGVAMSAMPFLNFFPLVSMVAICVLLGYWIVVFSFLASAGEWSDKTLIFVTSPLMRACLVYHFLGLFWTLFLIEAVEETTVAGAVATWYFTRDKKNGLPPRPIFSAWRRASFYSLGSLIFGAFIVNLVMVFRTICEYIASKFRDVQNPVLKYGCCCFACCTWIYDRILKAVSRNAYIQVAIYGTSFCSSANSGFALLLRNITRVAAVNTISDFLLFLGKLTVVFGTTAICALIMVGKNINAAPVVPTFICAVIAYTTAGAFFAICHVAIDTILMCFCEDCERNDGSSGREYYMSDSLKRYIETTHQQTSMK